LPKSFGENKISATTLKQYSKPFANKSERNEVLALVRSLLNDQEWFEELWKKRQSITSKPTLFIWGMKDPIIKPQNHKFNSAFTNATTLKLEVSGHFPQEEEPNKLTVAIHEFVTLNNHLIVSIYQ